MAEQFLTLMADFDDATQQLLATWQEALEQAGFTGTQTPGLPYHISLATFPPDKEEKAIALTRRIASAHGPVTVKCTHLGLFAGGKVIFAAPDITPELTALHKACGVEMVGDYPWTPHTTLLIDEKDVVVKAVPTAVDVFHPFQGTITKLHLCAFWPTREIITAELRG